MHNDPITKFSQDKLESLLRLKNEIINDYPEVAQQMSFCSERLKLNNKTNKNQFHYWSDFDNWTDWSDK